MAIDRSVITRQSPRARNIAANVAMNGWILNLLMTSPTISPINDPTTRTMTITIGAERPCCSRVAAITELSAITAPTDRSIPPVRITKVMPMASGNRNEFLLNRSIRA